MPGTAKYGQLLTVTVTGTNVNQGLDVSSSDCTGMALSVSPPLISTPSTAYYRCTASSANEAGFAQVSITPPGAPETALANPLFSVPLPQVTLTIKADTVALGTVVLDMDPNATPITVDNFLRYVNSGFYDRTIFHRLIKETVPAPFELIQAGAYAPTSGVPAPATKATQAPIALEFDPAATGVRNRQWSVGMSRLPGNEPDRQNSATAEFYINMIDNPSLDPTDVNAGNAVFATITSATRSVVTTIANAACTNVPGFSECLPLPNIIIDTAVQTR